MMVASRAPTTTAEALACFTPGVQALRKRSGEIAKLIEKEIAGWEKERDEALAKRQELLEQHLATAGDVEMEDSGEVVKAGAKTDAQATLVDSAVWSTSNGEAPASSIFRTQVRPAVSDAPKQAAASDKKRKATSLFSMPTTGNPFAQVSVADESSKQQALQSIQREFASALTNVLRAASNGTSSAPAPAIDAIEPQTMAPETVAFVPKTDRKTIPNGISGRYESLFVKPDSSASLQQTASQPLQQPADTSANADTSADFLELGNDPEGVVHVAKKRKADASARKAEKKRRKSDKAAAAETGKKADGGEKTKGGKQAPVDIQPYDFTKETDVMQRGRAVDDDTLPDAGHKGKERSKKGRDGDKAPKPKTGPAPRQRNEPSSGNRSFTFGR